jgi:hypothetical protein
MNPNVIKHLGLIRDSRQNLLTAYEALETDSRNTVESYQDLLRRAPAEPAVYSEDEINIWQADLKVAQNNLQRSIIATAEARIELSRAEIDLENEASKK